jgi:hypothetical protein
MGTVIHESDRTSPSRLESLIVRCEADRASHMTGGANSATELRAIQEALGHPLPHELRLFLLRLGGGVFYLKHEIFGARRVMIHDIELLPDIVHFRARLGSAVPAAVLPFHCVDSQIHAVELGDGPCAGVLALDETGIRYPTFADFLEQVVIPR